LSDICGVDRLYSGFLRGWIWNRQSRWQPIKENTTLESKSEAYILHLKVFVELLV
jgi:hypothetical protein